MKFVLYLCAAISCTYAKEFRINNQCPFTVWPGILGNAGKGSPESGGFQLDSMKTRRIQVGNDWSGRVWGRTNCNGVGHCETGDCGNKIQCQGAGGVPPVSLAAFTLNGAGGQDVYYISLVDGYNLPIAIRPIAGTYRKAGDGYYDCGNASCNADLNIRCPTELAIKNQYTATIACMSACTKYNTDKYCCRGLYSTPQTCTSNDWPVDYRKIFKSACPDAHSYAFDGTSSTFTCQGNSQTGYDIIICPLSSVQLNTRMSLGTILAIVLGTVVLVLVTVLFIYRKSIPFLKQPIHQPFTDHYIPPVPENSQPSNDSQSSSDGSIDCIQTYTINTDINDEEILPILPVESGVRSPRFQVSEEIMNTLRAEHILIERQNIVLCEVIGQGQFGQVYKALLHSPNNEVDKQVAVKTIIRDDMDVKLFLDEGLMMRYFSHQHVLTLIGVCFDDQGMPMVVLPYMQNGDLLAYIRNDHNNVTVKSLLMFAIQIAKGMNYLSGQRYVHRDLAARNCVLDSDLCVKVADFGLSRDIYETDYYRSGNKKQKLPVKWMSPESLKTGIYNTKTDVWSYGVLVWELLTRGVTPYPGVGNWEIGNYLKQGYRLSCPYFCPKLLYGILLRCWSVDPRLRPTFADLVTKVGEVITRLEKKADKQRLDLNKCNTYINNTVSNIYYNDYTT